MPETGASLYFSSFSCRTLFTVNTIRPRRMIENSAIGTRLKTTNRAARSPSRAELNSLHTRLVAKLAVRRSVRKDICSRILFTFHPGHVFRGRRPLGVYGERRHHGDNENCRRNQDPAAAQRAGAEAVDEGHGGQPDYAGDGGPEERSNSDPVLERVERQEHPQGLRLLFTRIDDVAQRRGDKQGEKATSCGEKQPPAGDVQHVIRKGDVSLAADCRLRVRHLRRPLLLATRHRRYAVVLDQVEVGCHQADEEQGQDGDVRDEQALQDGRAGRELRREPDTDAAQQLPYLLVMQQRLPPLLVPLEHGAGEDETEHHREQTDADDPVQLPGSAVAAGSEHALGMQQQGDGHQVGHPEVEAADEVAKASRGDYVLEAAPRLGGVAVVELGQVYAGCDENEDSERGDPAERVENAVRVRRHGVREVFQAQSLIDPAPHPTHRLLSPAPRRLSYDCWRLSQVTLLARYRAFMLPSLARRITAAITPMTQAECAILRSVAGRPEPYNRAGEPRETNQQKNP